MPAYAEKDFLGTVALWQTGPGAGPFTMVKIPAALAGPRNPKNNQYLPGINSSAYPNLKAPGKRTPMMMVRACAKASWFTAALLNSLIQTLDSNGDGDVYAIGLYQKIANAWRSYDGGKCAQIDLYQEASSGLVMVDMYFPVIWGDSEQGSPVFLNATTPLPGATSAGNLFDITSVTFASTADQVESWRLSLVRGQGRRHFVDGSYYGAPLASGQFSGVLTLQQSPTRTLLPSTSATIQVGGSGGVLFTLTLSNDEMQQDKGVSFATQVNTWSLYDGAAGGNPCAITLVP